MEMVKIRGEIFARRSTENKPLVLLLENLKNDGGVSDLGLGNAMSSTGDLDYDEAFYARRKLNN